MAKIDIETRDGVCPTHVFRPGPGGAEGASAGAPKLPAVLVYMDGVGMRPAMVALGERLAQSGYVVLLPDLYYRSGPYEPMDGRTLFSDPAQRAMLRDKFAVHATAPNIMSDTGAFLDYLASQPDVASGGIATVGYCMGGFLSLTAAGTFPDHVVAAASFHGSRLATDQPESPHLLAPKMRARIYVGGAIEDATFPDDMRDRLEAALTDAKVSHTLETYQARHGWVFPDLPTYDPAASERHWVALLSFLRGAFPASA